METPARQESQPSQLVARRKAILLATVLDNPFIPDQYKAGITAKQAELLTDESREIFFGGAGGGGKSCGGLMAMTQYVTEPGYSSLILRRTYQQLAKSDSILSLAKEWWLPNPVVKFNADIRTFRFPSGATIEFGHMEDENAKFNYQGGAWRGILFDELTQFYEPMYVYPFSRQRKTKLLTLPLRTISTGNPGGVGHEWVRKRFIDPKTRRKGARFIPAKLSDNPNLDIASYRESLSYLDSLTRRQIEDGDWNAIEGGRFNAGWFQWYQRDENAAEYIRLANGERFRIMDRPIFMTVDPAASDKRTADYTVIGVFTTSPKGNLIWLACERFQKQIPDIPAEIVRMCRRWKPIVVGVEAVASNRAVLQLLQRHTNPIIPCCPMTPRGQEKLVRATAAMVLAESGRLYLPEDNSAFPLDDVVGELTRFTGDDTKDDHDDIVDVLSYGCELATRFQSGGNHQGVPSATGAPNPLDGPAPSRPGASKPVGGFGFGKPGINKSRGAW